MHIQDQLREVILKRIERGTLDQRMLCGMACVSPSHVSNFLRGRRDLGGQTLEKIMKAVGFEAEIFPSSANQQQRADLTGVVRGTHAPGSPAQLGRAGGSATAKSGHQTPGRPVKLPCKKP